MFFRGGEKISGRCLAAWVGKWEGGGGCTSKVRGNFNN